MRGYQFVAHREWLSLFGFTRLDPARTDMALIEWYAWLGFWEVRKWCSAERQKRSLAESCEAEG